ncbi:low temperature requirement protein A [Streptomyces sp. NPDC127197]|uniref:low temperature requirement protein A n=1 Tax=Streptomyces sp. NPDC127197 TaxID=3345388 RepID=UPI00362C2EE1
MTPRARPTAAHAAITGERGPGRSLSGKSPCHIAERYGLFTLIVLGEAVAAATVAVRNTLDAQAHFAGPLCAVAAGGLLMCFALWWPYFAAPPTPCSPPRTMRTGTAQVGGCGRS